MYKGASLHICGVISTFFSLIIRRGCLCNSCQSKSVKRRKASSFLPFALHRHMAQARHSSLIGYSSFLSCCIPRNYSLTLRVFFCIYLHFFYLFRRSDGGFPFTFPDASNGERYREIERERDSTDNIIHRMVTTVDERFV